MAPRPRTPTNEWLPKLTQELVSQSVSFSDLCRKIGLTESGARLTKLKRLIQKMGIDFSHFGLANPNLKWPYIIKECPVCGKPFSTQQGKRKEKVTCSYSCSNTYFSFKKRKKKPVTETIIYRNTCFEHHPKKCVICGESRIVAVHHWDSNKTNNSPENLIPLCPTHHQYFHSRYKAVYQKEVEDYIQKWISARQDSNLQFPVPKTGALAN